MNRGFRHKQRNADGSRSNNNNNNNKEYEDDETQSRQTHTSTPSILRPATANTSKNLGLNRITTFSQSTKDRLDERQNIVETPQSRIMRSSLNKSMSAPYVLSKNPSKIGRGGGGIGGNKRRSSDHSGVISSDTLDSHSVSPKLLPGAKYPSDFMPWIALSAQTRGRIKTLIISRYYCVVWWIFYLVLLFGSAIRDIIGPNLSDDTGLNLDRAWMQLSLSSPEAVDDIDFYFNIMFVVALVFFLIDMVLMGYVSSSYLLCYFDNAALSTQRPSGEIIDNIGTGAVNGNVGGEHGRRGSDNSRRGSRSSAVERPDDDMTGTHIEYNADSNIVDDNNNSDDLDEPRLSCCIFCCCFCFTPSELKTLCRFRIGTIGFWFDLLCTLTLLFDLTWVRSNAVDPYTDIEITLDEQGEEITEWDKNRQRVKPPFAFILILFRTLRIIRMKPKMIVKCVFDVNLFIARKVDNYNDKLEIHRTRQQLKAKSANIGTQYALGVLRSVFADKRGATAAISKSGSGSRSNNSSGTFKRSIHLDLTRNEAATMIQRAFRDAYEFQQPVSAGLKDVLSVTALDHMKSAGSHCAGGIKGLRGDGFSAAGVAGSSWGYDMGNSANAMSSGAKSVVSRRQSFRTKDKTLFQKTLQHLGLAKSKSEECTENVSLRSRYQSSVNKTRNKKDIETQRTFSRQHVRRKGRSGKDIGSSNRFPNASAGTGPSGDSDGGGSLEARRSGSMVGNRMMKVTGQRVAFGMFIAVLFTIVFTYFEYDATLPLTMITLHNIEVSVGKNMSDDISIVNTVVNAASASATPNLCEYKTVNGTSISPTNSTCGLLDLEYLRDREISNITVCTVREDNDICSHGQFNIRNKTSRAATASLVLTIYIIIVWYLAMGMFSIPVSALIVIPIERMVRFLGMLVKDPLGYQSTKSYWGFIDEEEIIFKKTKWKKDVMDGMETKFLINSISRISNLMKVGFGSAGVEIIRSHLGKEARNGGTFGNLVGLTVSCLFLFGDIRGFTDASECLQEEVFVFTNRVASVVHSFCNSLGGSVNKNIGDAFLISWLLDSNGSTRNLGDTEEDDGVGRMGMMTKKRSYLKVKNNQADKALLSVVKICVALQYDDFYLKAMSENAKKRLKERMSKRPGALVQMGFGLHAGKAVQGAIGSERKLDATYISEAVEIAENLESLTKKYGLKVLMSGVFYDLLTKSSQRRCRKIDQVKLTKPEENEESAYDALDDEAQDIMHLYTFDMVVEDYWQKKTPEKNVDNFGSSRQPAEISSPRSDVSGKTSSVLGTDSKDTNRQGSRSKRRWSVTFDNQNNNQNGLESDEEHSERGSLKLPNTVFAFKPTAWLKDDIRRMRRRYTARFYATFRLGLESYFNGEWEAAKGHFETVRDDFDDPASNYFLKKMEKTNYVTPHTFSGYGSA